MIAGTSRPSMPAQEGRGGEGRGREGKEGDGRGREGKGGRDVGSQRRANRRVLRCWSAAACSRTHTASCAGKPAWSCALVAFMPAAVPTIVPPRVCQPFCLGQPKCAPTNQMCNQCARCATCSAPKGAGLRDAAVSKQTALCYRNADTTHAISKQTAACYDDDSSVLWQAQQRAIANT